MPYIEVQNHEPIEDLTGQKFGKWEVLEYLGASTWRCRCECGTETPITGWRLQRTSMCSRCCKALPDAEAAFRSVFDTYRGNAQRSNREFTLTMDDAKTLFGGNCSYCGKPPQTTRKARRYHLSGFKYNGIDRVDNGKGYVISNCVSCCSICNRMKFKLSAHDFAEHVCAIAAHCKYLEKAAYVSSANPR